ncbi:MAG TPA: HEAT repeat domain-containing protein, partial [Planctomycetota bacterium]|nr:HEAT repeat domain-containing protein [Planctomycetota bacterium]
FRCKPDGTRVEVVCGGGMDNPVEVAFLETGEPIVTVALLHAQPKRVDSLIYAIEGGVFPYHDVLREFKRTGELLPSVLDVGWVAPSGLCRARNEENVLYSAHFNTHAVQRHVLERDGAGFRGRSEDFLTCDHPDFHPTDVLEDADGSLLVLDTGGWFRIGCPTSQIDKPQVKGAVWRVRRKDAAKIDDPRGLRLDWTSPKTEWLDDPRPAVRDRAIETIADAPLEGPTPRARRNAVWARARSGRPVAAALADPDRTVRLAAARVAGLEREVGAAPALVGCLQDESPAVRREAAAALGRLRAKAAVAPLLEALADAGDRFLEHALVYALIDIGDAAAVRAGLQHPHAGVRRGALLALDQLEALAREELTPCLDPSQPALLQAALWVLSNRPGWAGEIAGLLRTWLDGPPRPEIRGVVVAFARDPQIQDLVARALREPATSAATRTLLLEIMAQAPLDRLPATWIAEVRWCLDSPDAAVVRQAVGTLRAAGIADFPEPLLALARDPARGDELRVEALAAARPSRLEPALFDLLRAAAAPAQPPLLRLAAAQALAGAGLDDKQQGALVQVVASAGPLELPRLLAAFEKASKADVGRRLLAALEKSPALESLPADALRRAVAGFPDDVRAQAAPLLKRLEGDAEVQRARLRELEPLLSGGEAARGREVFFGRKASCFACHAVHGQGGRVGPDLSKIGGIRAPRDLLESVVFPSASLVRGYEPTALRTKDGTILDGVIVRETAEAITLALADRTEKRVPRAAIDDLRAGRTSIMPAGLDQQLAPDELRDLIAFLRSLR